VCLFDLAVRYSFPTRRSSDLSVEGNLEFLELAREVDLTIEPTCLLRVVKVHCAGVHGQAREQVLVRLCSIQEVEGFVERIAGFRSEEHTSELQSRENLVGRLL